MAQFVDWDLAAATAGALGKPGPRVTLREASDVVAQLRDLADEAAGHVEAFTGMAPAGRPAPIRVVDRRDWAGVNIAGLRQVIIPARNADDLDDIPEDVKAEMTFHTLESIDQVLDVALA